MFRRSSVSVQLLSILSVVFRGLPRPVHTNVKAVTTFSFLPSKQIPIMPLDAKTEHEQYGIS
jgi:hypothetical protein